MAATVGIRELRQNLSRYIERVKDGESLVLSLGGDLGVLVTYDARLHAAARVSGVPVARPGRPA